MASRSTRSDVAPLIAIVGETGSGKTALAIELARRLNGEIICADSRTVYTGMDIGTAKPTLQERSSIPHYGLDLVEPGQPFSAYDFQQLAYQAIDDIAGRGKLPIMVGGTGLYVDAVLYDFTFRAPADPVYRQALQAMTVAELQREVERIGAELPENDRNPRHLIRLIESGPAPRQPRKLRDNTLVLGMRLPTAGRAERLTSRVESMFAAGLITEVQHLSERYRDVEAFRAPGYSAVLEYLAGNIDLAEAKRRCVRDHLRLAKHQRTWFRRNEHIHWLDNRDILAQAVELITTLTLK